MPAALSYPGVYIEEVPSGVRTITGVPTAICAYVGRTAAGPIDTPVVVNSFGDFERIHGGLAVKYPLSYAVRDFFLNGGAQALVVRLYKQPGVASPPTSPPSAADGLAKIQIGAAPTRTVQAPVRLRAVSPGAWANSLRVGMIPAAPSLAAQLGLPAGTQVFDLVVKFPDTQTVAERHRNVTFDDGPRRFDRVLASESNLIRALTPLPDPADPNTLVANYATTSGSPPTPLELTPTDAGGEVGGDGLALTEPGDFLGALSTKTGLFALEKADLFNLLCIPPDARGGDLPAGVLTSALAYCVTRRAMLLIDPPTSWNSVANAAAGLSALGLSGLDTRNGIAVFPSLLQPDPLRGGQLDTFVPCGAVAGVIAATDARRGVFKAPAGIDAGLVGVRGLSVGGGAAFSMTDDENGLLNPLGINCLRVFPVIGPVVWGARTLRGADQLADEYKYIPVRRLVLFIEETLYRGTKFAVFEPNDEPLWSQIRLNVGSFMQTLFRQGAFQGQSPQEAYFVKCDKETTTQDDINRGIVNVVVGFAPLKPAEFVVIKIQQIAGQTAA
jgi:Bacteriophage tail sheath protein